MKRVFGLLIVLFSGALLIGNMLNGGFSEEGVGEEKRLKESEDIKGKLAEVEQFNYYLDEGTQAIGEEMKKVDLVIIEPILMQEEYITAAQDSGTLVYGYINSMEADKWNQALYHQLLENDFYKDKNGNKMYFEKWDSYLMDMSSEHYQHILLEEIKAQITDKKLDGVFLDTVGNIDSYLSGSEQKTQNEALTSFVKKIKNENGNLSIAQNWGFDTLAKYTAPYVDFIMWEDFSYSVVREDEWALEKMDQLKQIRNRYHTQVVTIAFKDEEKSKQLARKHGFKFLYHPEGSYYNKW
ncbi:endo alpha-1,4 polygalactosaminidase [Peribacillus sp. FSL H8-0477]|uniref:endo alpha-1,4 polygalactosaminidase n=1 Tax=Peribacillus sp. FSL H8-0477 TaxID=2921388 RepID=UPI0030F8D9EE